MKKAKMYEKKCAACRRYFFSYLPEIRYCTNCMKEDGGKTGELFVDENGPAGPPLVAGT